MHKTRSQASGMLPIPRKGTKFIAVARHNQDNSIPLVMAMRDLLKLGKTRKEIKIILMSGKIKVNGKTVKDEKFPLSLFDILDLDDRKYKTVIVNKKIALEETKEHEKISKIIRKTMVKGKKIQVNLSDGRNFIGKEKANVGDSVAFNFKENKIAKVIAFKEGADVIVTGGSHIGETGKLGKIDEKRGEAEVKLKDGKVNLQTGMLMAI
jgi:small subunit ribosomal protein S4e